MNPKSQCIAEKTKNIRLQQKVNIQKELRSCDLFQEIDENIKIQLDDFYDTEIKTHIEHASNIGKHKIILNWKIIKNHSIKPHVFIKYLLNEGFYFKNELNNFHYLTRFTISWEHLI
jgi:hypothetical protein